MPIPGIPQPALLPISPTLRLRAYDGHDTFALPWYQDGETLWLVDGTRTPYTLETMHAMYRYLQARGELYIIEGKDTPLSDFYPIGDVTFWQDDLPIVIGEKTWRNKGVGKQVLCALIDRARVLSFPYLKVSDIYDYNLASQKLFKSVGFRVDGKTEKGHSYRLSL